MNLYLIVTGHLLQSQKAPCGLSNGIKISVLGILLVVFTVKLYSFTGFYCKNSKISILQAPQILRLQFYKCLVSFDVQLPPQLPFTWIVTQIEQNHVKTPQKLAFFLKLQSPC